MRVRTTGGVDGTGPRWLGQGQLPARIGTILRHSLLPQGGEVAALARGRPLPGIARAARWHGIPGYVRRALMSVPGADPTAIRDLGDGVEAALHVHLRSLAAVAELQQRCAAIGITPLVIKGPVLTELLHRRADGRAYGDLDVLVPARDFGRALASLEAAGAVVGVSDWRSSLRYRAGEVPLVLPSGLPLDLHWHVLNEDWAREAFVIPMPELFERAGAAELNGVTVQTLGPTDMLLHLGVHTCRSGNDRLVWLKDIERAVAVVQPDWDDVVSRARAWRVGPPVAVALDRSRQVLDAEIPQEVIQALAQGRLWLGLSRVAGRLSPTQRATGARTADRMLARATRGTQAESFFELSRRTLWRWRSLGPAAQGDLSSDAAREAYLRGVAAGSWEVETDAVTDRL